MEESGFITLIIFGSFFLALTSLIQEFTRRTGFPYTVALLITGFFFQFLVYLSSSFLPFEIEKFVNFKLSTHVIFYLLLPVLLFEAAFHINFHQFKLQFKTITLLSTFGLLLSTFIVGVGLFILLHIPFGVALLFGALISATDPIAVLALFKTLGAPKRLALIADGESMFNDATAVILFRIILGFVAGQYVLEATHGIAPSPHPLQAIDIVVGIEKFLYVFLGSLFYGGLLGYITSVFIERVNNDKLVETTVTAILALFSFASAEHFFHLSGVISCVMAGITLGNLGKTTFSSGVIQFVSEFWEYLGFLALSLVFFFAAYNLNVSFLLSRPLELLVVIVVVLIARALSVYISFWVTNKVSYFKNEPNVPIVWQHIINWGGLRGVIPLVLVLTLPETFPYREMLMSFTFAVFLFTVLINGTTIRWLLLHFKLHLPPQESAIISEEMSIFEIEKAREQLKKLETFDKKIVEKEDYELTCEEHRHKRNLLDLATPETLLRSLKIEAIDIERQSLERLFLQGYISDNVFHAFDAELDLQQDALEYPELESGRGYEEGGFLPKKSFRHYILKFRTGLSTLPFISKLSPFRKECIIEERYSLLQARIIASMDVLHYLESVEKMVGSHEKCKQAINTVRAEHERFITTDKSEIEDIKKEYPGIVDTYQKRILKNLIWKKGKCKASHHQ